MSDILTTDSATNPNRPDEAAQPSPAERRFTDGPRGMHPAAEIWFRFALILAWVVMFAAGTFVPTEKYRKGLLDGWIQERFAEWFLDWLIVIGCYTVTIILFLALLSACIGCMTGRWRVSATADTVTPFYSGLPAMRCYLAALLRGFFLYLMIISGLLVLGTESSVQEMTFAQYIRIAGITSVFGFMVGYDPSIVYRLMGRLRDIANSPLRGGEQRRSS
jgi:hypothetical protein